MIARISIDASVNGCVSHSAYCNHAVSRQYLYIKIVIRSPIE